MMTPSQLQTGAACSRSFGWRPACRQQAGSQLDYRYHRTSFLDPNPKVEKRIQRISFYSIQTSWSWRLIGRERPCVFVFGTHLFRGSERSFLSGPSGSDLIWSSWIQLSLLRSGNDLDLLRTAAGTWGSSPWLQNTSSSWCCGISHPFFMVVSLFLTFTT